MKTEKLAGNLWKFTGSDSVNIYYLHLERHIIIDAGNRMDRSAFEAALRKVIALEKIELVLFTHLHYDHRGNVGLFPNAEFYASEKEIADFKSGSLSIFASDDDTSWLGKKLRPLPADICSMDVIPSPGHTAGGVMFWHKDKGILFTGDTYFREGVYGRTDLPTSSAEDMGKSIKKVSAFPYRILCPGHDY
ncbi:MBL fold metallo-hydrolase [Candidatus Woesearchaeota archaeon]|nr:MBL fold metallo-hydrolase [Candidatus Woesearchaeota archaeon]